MAPLITSGSSAQPSVSLLNHLTPLRSREPGPRGRTGSCHTAWRGWPVRQVWDLCPLPHFSPVLCHRSAQAQRQSSCLIPCTSACKSFPSVPGGSGSRENTAPWVLQASPLPCLPLNLEPRHPLQPLSPPAPASVVVKLTVLSTQVVGQVWASCVVFQIVLQKLQGEEISLGSSTKYSPLLLNTHFPN